MRWVGAQWLSALRRLQMSTTNHFSRMPGLVMRPSAYENMYGTSNLPAANRKKKPAVCWVIVRCSMYACLTPYRQTSAWWDTMWLWGFHVNIFFFFLTARKRTFVTLTSNFSLVIITAWQHGRQGKLGLFDICVHLQIVCCAYTGTCLYVRGCVGTCAQKVFCTNRSDCHKGVFACTLFSRLVWLPTENNYSLWAAATVEGQNGNWLHSPASEDVTPPVRREEGASQ